MSPVIGHIGHPEHEPDGPHYIPFDGVDQLTPLKLSVGRELLIAVVEDAIAAIERNRAAVTDPNEQFEVDLLLQQRQEFLVYLQQHPDINLYMAMFPANPYHADEESEG